MGQGAALHTEEVVAVIPVGGEQGASALKDATLVREVGVNKEHSIKERKHGDAKNGDNTEIPTSSEKTLILPTSRSLFVEQEVVAKDESPQGVLDSQLIWKSSLSLLREKLDPQIYAAWIKPLRPLGCSVVKSSARSTDMTRDLAGDMAVENSESARTDILEFAFQVPNRFCRDHVDLNYKALIEHSLLVAVNALVSFGMCSFNVGSIKATFKVSAGVGSELKVGEKVVKRAGLEVVSQDNRKNSAAKRFEPKELEKITQFSALESLEHFQVDGSLDSEASKKTNGLSTSIGALSEGAFSPASGFTLGTGFSSGLGVNSTSVGNLGASHSNRTSSERTVRTVSHQSNSQSAAVAEESNLNPKYNFSNFVVGGCNQFAHAACLRVAEEPGCHFNPLFIYGGVGLGKTHLANAIGNANRRRNKKVLLVTSETFVSELINSLRSNRMQQFKTKFRSLDLLIIDDIQFIIGKERTQEEFFHTFNDLYNRHKQIVITSDKLPQELVGLEERLRTRFASGLAVDLQAPDFETRVAILSKKAEAGSFLLPDDVARYLADNINTNVRELEGALTRLSALSSLHNVPVSMDLAEGVIKSLTPRRSREINTDDIQRNVGEWFNVSTNDLLGKRRTQNVALARQVAMYLCRKVKGMSFPEIGALFGGRDHSTAIHGFRCITERLLTDKQLAAAVEQIERGFV